MVKLYDRDGNIVLADFNTECVQGNNSPTTFIQKHFFPIHLRTQKLTTLSLENLSEIIDSLEQAFETPIAKEDKAIKVKFYDALNNTAINVFKELLSRKDHIGSPDDIRDKNPDKINTLIVKLRKGKLVDASPQLHRKAIQEYQEQIKVPLHINVTTLPFKNRHALNEQIYRSYVAWRSAENKEPTYDNLCDYLNKAYQLCLFSYQNKQISSGQRDRMISSIKRLQLDASYQHAHDLFEKEGIASNLTTIFLTKNTELVDHHLSTSSRMLAQRTNTRSSLDIIAHAYSDDSENNRITQGKIARIFSAEKPGTIASIEKKMTFEKEFGIDWQAMSHANTDAFVASFMRISSKVVQPMSANSTGLSTEGTQYLENVKRCVTQLEHLYEHVINGVKAGMIDKTTENHAIQALKKMMCDLAFTLHTSDKFDALHVGSHEKLALLAKMENSPLVKHHRNTGLKSFFSREETATQKEIKTLNDVYRIDSKTTASKKQFIKQRYEGAKTEVDALLEGRFEPTAPQRLTRA